MKINQISMNFYTNSTIKPYRQQQPILPTVKCDSVHFTGKSQLTTKKVIILLGAPNSGKGTFARKIAEKHSLPQISTGDILRNEVKISSKLGLEAKKYMDSGELVPDSLILKIFQKRITQEDCQKGFILDGFPRTINQAKELDKVLEKEKNIVLKIINLDVEKDILFQRSANRYTCADCSKTFSIKEGYNPENSKCDCGGKLIKRADDTPEVLANRLISYEKQTLPLVGYYGEKVSNIDVYGEDAPMQKTLNRVFSVIENN